MEQEPKINRYLRQMLSLGGSDLHLSINFPAKARVHGNIQPLDDVILTPEVMEEMLKEICLPPKRWTKFMETHDLDFAHEIPGLARFRCNYFYNYHGMGCVLRQIPSKILTMQELKLPETLVEICNYKSGLVLVTGPTGSGKTTSLYAFLNTINTPSRKIITVEDPIEILQLSKNCQVTQREVGRHTESYSRALKGALREDPDIIVIGEMHDLETIENAITASETGHLVIGTLHTCDAANTMNRILDVFPPNQQPQIRAMTAGSLRGIICQRLIPATDGRLTAAYEILVNTMAVGNIISEGKVFQLKATMQIGGKSGMCTLDQNLLAKFKAGEIAYETALEYMTSPTEIASLNKEKAIQEAKKLAANMPPPGAQ